MYRVTGITEDQGEDEEDHQEEDYDEVYEVRRVLGPPYFITVHQLVEVMERDTAVLECAVTNIDTAVTVSLNDNKYSFFIICNIQKIYHLQIRCRCTPCIFCLSVVNINVHMITHC